MVVDTQIEMTPLTRTSTLMYTGCLITLIPSLQEAVQLLKKDYTQVALSTESVDVTLP